MEVVMDVLTDGLTDKAPKLIAVSEPEESGNFAASIFSGEFEEFWTNFVDNGGDVEKCCWNKGLRRVEGEEEEYRDSEVEAEQGEEIEADFLFLSEFSSSSRPKINSLPPVGPPPLRGRGASGKG